LLTLSPNIRFWRKAGIPVEGSTYGKRLLVNRQTAGPGIRRWIRPS
jgi:hypothetical protein